MSGAVATISPRDVPQTQPVNYFAKGVEETSHAVADHVSSNDVIKNTMKSAGGVFGLIGKATDAPVCKVLQGACKDMDTYLSGTNILAKGKDLWTILTIYAIAIKEGIQRAFIVLGSKLFGLLAAFCDFVKLVRSFGADQFCRLGDFLSKIPVLKIFANVTVSAAKNLFTILGSAFSVTEAVTGFNELKELKIADWTKMPKDRMVEKALKVTFNIMKIVSSILSLVGVSFISWPMVLFFAAMSGVGIAGVIVKGKNDRNKEALEIQAQNMLVHDATRLTAAAA